jgi:hypothetical protein
VRQGIPEVIHLWWVRRRWRLARQRVRSIEAEWWRIGCQPPPWTSKYMRALEVELYWREQLRLKLR